MIKYVQVYPLPNHSFVFFTPVVGSHCSLPLEWSKRTNIEWNSHDFPIVIESNKHANCCVVLVLLLFWFNNNKTFKPHISIMHLWPGLIIRPEWCYHKWRAKAQVRTHPGCFITPTTFSRGLWSAAVSQPTKSFLRFSLPTLIYLRSLLQSQHLTTTCRHKQTQWTHL